MPWRHFDAFVPPGVRTVRPLQCACRRAGKGCGPVRGWRRGKVPGPAAAVLEVVKTT